MFVCGFISFCYLSAYIFIYIIFLSTFISWYSSLCSSTPGATSMQFLLANEAGRGNYITQSPGQGRCCGIQIGKGIVSEALNGRENLRLRTPSVTEEGDASAPVSWKTDTRRRVLWRARVGDNLVAAGSAYIALMGGRGGIWHIRA